MDTNQTAILAALLALSNEVIVNNISDPEIQTNITSINSITATDSSFVQLIIDNIRNMIDISTASNQPILTTIINGLTSITINAPALLGVLTMRNLNNPQSIANYIDSEIISNINDFNYYSALSRLAISLGDSKRISAVLTKIQSLTTSGS
jgi:hypothetical protein